MTENQSVLDQRSASDTILEKLPEIDLSELDVAVVRLIDEAMGAVRREPRYADRWGRLGMLLLAHDLFPSAASCLSEAARLNPIEPLWPYYESIARRTIDPIAALAPLRRAVNLFEDGSPTPRNRLAELLIEVEQLDGAEVVLSEVIQREPENVRAHVTRAKLHLLRNEPEQALASIERAGRSTPPTRSMLLVAAEAHRRLGEADAAVRDSERALSAPAMDKNDPLYESVLALRTGLKVKLTEADGLFQRNQVDASNRILERLVIDYPESQWATIVLARGYIRKRQLNEAKSILEKALRLNADSFQANFRMGVVFQIEEQHRLAAAWFEKAIRVQPSSAVALKNLATSQFRLGDREGAERNFKRAIQVQPNYFEGHVALGDYYIKSRNFGAAQAAFQTALDLRPANQAIAKTLEQLDTLLHQENRQPNTF